jgi:arginyl-tRNA synthetase
MKKKLRKLILNALRETSGDIGQLEISEKSFDINVPKHKDHGDFATNAAMVLSKALKMKPRDLAAMIKDAIDDPSISKVEIAGPGFINFFVDNAGWQEMVLDIIEEGDDYGRQDLGGGLKVQVEFVSANPTGPLHVGHGRGAAVGDSLAGLLDFCGYNVQREYYINNVGNQARTLGESVLYRGRQLLGESQEFPENCYQGEYISDLAKEFIELNGEDALQAGGDELIDKLAGFAQDKILSGIRSDLAAFGIEFDEWFGEDRLYSSGKAREALSRLSRDGYIYEKEGAQWFASSKFGDDKDRVVQRDNGIPTYFAADIAYHLDKMDRGFDRIINIWGADHHGYVSRIKAAVQAFGLNPDDIHILLVQLVSLLRDGKPVAMSTRAGEFVTLADVISEVGADAARFIFLTRSHDSQLDFDLEVAKRKSNDNPVFYVQYAHARICSIFREAVKAGFSEDGLDEGCIGFLDQPEDLELIKFMGRFPGMLESSARALEPHRITYYLQDLAANFHRYYNKHRVIGEDDSLTHARLLMVKAIRTVLRNGLRLLSVGAPETM